MVYSPQLSPLFDKNFKRLTKKNIVLKERNLKKIRDILQNPEIGETLNANLAGYRSVHVGNWVIIYRIMIAEVWFVNFDHHDYAYNV
jgi:mRNA-degrading endonuclease RelE of RelBE toxin-antitoxin system